MRASYVKVAEFQRRGVVHFHTLWRLDGVGDELVPPPAFFDAQLLANAIAAALPKVSVPAEASGADPGRHPPAPDAALDAPRVRRPRRPPRGNQERPGAPGPRRRRHDPDVHRRADARRAGKGDRGLPIRGGANTRST